MTGTLSDSCQLTIGQSKGAVVKVMGPSNRTQTVRTKLGGYDYVEWDGVDGDILVASFQNGSDFGLHADAGTIGPDPATNLMRVP